MIYHKLKIIDINNIFMKKFCEKLSSDECQILKYKCFRLNIKEECEFKNHFKLLQVRAKKYPKSTLVKQKMLPDFLQQWTNFAKKPATGKKGMTGFPLERAIRDTLKSELSSLSVEIKDQGEKWEIWDDTCIIADVLIKKEHYPTTVVSVKSWIGPTQIRETYASAYFSKTWLGQKNIRIYMATLHPIKPNLNQLIKVTKPYVDDVFSLSSKPYFDALIKTLKILYT